tara:strand:+ start:467 stop:751 length:285 start_codon:yes stop_codon:yes gene_type:complete
MHRKMVSLHPAGKCTIPAGHNHRPVSSLPQTLRQIKSLLLTPLPTEFGGNVQYSEGRYFHPTVANSGPLRAETSGEIKISPFTHRPKSKNASTH